MVFGLPVGMFLAFLVAAMPHPSGKHYYFEIMLPGSILGAVVGFATQQQYDLIFFFFFFFFFLLLLFLGGGGGGGRRIADAASERSERPRARSHAPSPHRLDRLIRHSPQLDRHR